ncbi:MAG: hypothetical protein ACLFUK_06845 [Halanaerobium sp.]
MDKAVIDAIEYIDTAVNKTEQIDDYSPEMSEKVLDNRIMTLEGYIRYIERETMPKLENLVEILEVGNNG